MLRIAKIVKILQKYNDNHDIGPYAASLSFLQRALSFAMSAQRANWTVLLPGSCFSST